MSRNYSFRVPAGTSNLGAGFDTLGLALEIYLRVRIEPASKTEIVALGVDSAEIPTTSDNLILRVANRVAALRNRELPPFRITIANEIPLMRGLGSSAAAIIAGITCYELAMQETLTEREIFKYAFEFETHPDNLSPALRGGLVAACQSSDSEVFIANLSVAPGVKSVIVVPEFEVSTQKARSVLPQSYTRKDAVYNIQRSALIVGALTTGNWPLLQEAMNDRVHQPYRASLIPGFEEILALRMPGMFGLALSGAGPTIFALADPAKADAVGWEITGVFEKHGVKALPHVVNIDTEGRVISRETR
jgi:homoserine kinase